MTNQSALPIEVDLYDYHTLQDNDDIAIDVINGGLGLDNATSSVITPSLNTWGVTPYMSTRFKG